MSRVLHHQKTCFQQLCAYFRGHGGQWHQWIINTESKKTGNRYNCCQTGSSYITGNRRAREEILVPVSRFSSTSYSLMTKSARVCGNVSVSASLFVDPYLSPYPYLCSCSWNVSVFVSVDIVSVSVYVRCLWTRLSVRIRVRVRGHVL